MIGVGSGRVHSEGKEPERPEEAQSRARRRNRHDGVERMSEVGKTPLSQTDRQRATCPSLRGPTPRLSSAAARPASRHVALSLINRGAKLAGIYFGWSKTGQAVEWVEENPWSE